MCGGEADALQQQPGKINCKFECSARKVIWIMMYGVLVLRLVQERDLVLKQQR